MRRSGGCLARSRRSSVLLSTCQAQAPVRLGCEVGWVGNAKGFLDVAVCVAWCHVATIKTCTADQACQYSSRPVLESNEDHGNRPGSRDFGHFDGQIDHIGSQHFKSILFRSILWQNTSRHRLRVLLVRVTFDVGRSLSPENCVLKCAIAALNHLHT